MATLNALIRDAIYAGYGRFLDLPADEQDKLIAAFAAERVPSARSALSEGLADDDLLDRLARHVLAYLGAGPSLVIASDIATAVIGETKVRIAIELIDEFRRIAEAVEEPEHDDPGPRVPLPSESAMAARPQEGS